MNEFWSNHVYLLYILTVGLFVCIGYFIRNFINTNTTAIKDLYDKYNDHQKRISTIEGELEGWKKGDKR